MLTLPVENKPASHADVVFGVSPGILVAFVVHLDKGCRFCVRKKPSISNCQHWPRHGVDTRAVQD